MIKINVMSAVVAVSFSSVGKIVEKTTDLLQVYRHILLQIVISSTPLSCTIINAVSSTLHLIMYKNKSYSFIGNK